MWQKQQKSRSTSTIIFGMDLSAKATAVLCIVLVFDFVSGEIFSSMVHVETLMETEMKLLDILREAKQRETEKLNLAKRYVSKFKKAYNAHLADTWEDIASSPVKAFQFIRHVTAEWKELSGRIEESLVTEYAASVRLLRHETLFPDEDDIQGSAMAFHRLQNTYRIHPRDIAYGRIPGTRTTPVFNAREAFIVGHRHASEGQSNSAAAWLEVALEIFHSESEKTTAHTELLDWLQLSIWTDTGNAVKALALMLKIQQVDPSYPNIPDNVKFYGDILNNSTNEEMERMKTEVTELRYDDDHYAALCRGEDLMDPETARQLDCYLESYGNPYLLIQPVKIELANLDPVVIVVHNAILKSQAERVKAIGAQHLSRAQVGAAGDVSDARISKIAFLDDTLHDVIKKVNAYIGHATNLNVTQAEQLQINNYGVGGYYYLHHDFLIRDNEIDPQIGDRMATFLMYMSDVEAGGATVFPHLNLTLFPEKGAAAFWYNLHLDGTPDQWTLHSDGIQPRCM